MKIHAQSQGLQWNMASRVHWGLREAVLPFFDWLPSCRGFELQLLPGKSAEWCRF